MVLNQYAMQNIQDKPIEISDKMKTLKVVALTGGKNRPSARFRIRQYQNELAANNIQLIEFCPFINQQVHLPGLLGRIRRRYLLPWLFLQVMANLLGRIPAFVGARRADLTLINRSIVPGLEEFVCLLPRPRVLDVDDAIWLTNPRGKQAAAWLARQVDAVIAGNGYLAKWYGQYNKNVFIIPTAIDTEQYFPADLDRRMEKQFCTIGWIGTSGNFSNLEIVKHALMTVLNNHPNSRVLIISDRQPVGWSFDGKRLVFRKWSAKTELRDLQDMDIGLMPLLDNKWTRGKCSFKMLQYLAVGIPAVVSPVGMNRDILNSADVGYGPLCQKDWVNALSRLCQSADLRRVKGCNGRKLVEESFSVKEITRQFSIIVRKLIPSQN